MFRVVIKAPCTRHYCYRLVRTIAVEGGRIVNTNTLRGDYLPGESDSWQIEYTVEFRFRYEMNKFIKIMSKYNAGTLVIREVTSSPEDESSSASP